MQIASVATVSGWITSLLPSRIATVSGLPSDWLRWMFSIVTVALSTSRPIASARPPSVIRLMVCPVRNRPTMPAKIDSGIEVETIDRVAPASQEHQDQRGDQDRRDDRLADDVLHRGAHEHRLVEIELQFQPGRRRGLDFRQRGTRRIDHGEGRRIGMLQDGQVDRALAVDVHDVGLGGEAVADMRRRRRM